MKTETTTLTRTIRTGLLTGAAAAALLVAPHLAGRIAAGSIDLGGTAYAQDHGSGGKGGQGGRGYRGGRGTGGPAASGGGHDEGLGEDSHSRGGHSGEDHGGDSNADEGHGDSGTGGPKYMGGRGSAEPGRGSSGGRPVWAQEGVPEVELGRLNVSRSPSQVLNRALTEAVSNFNPAVSGALYSKTADAFAADVAANWATVTIIDSPVQNLGLLKDLLSNGRTSLSGVTPASKVDLAAIFLGTASDKTIPVTRNTVVAVTKILGLSVTEAEADSIAAKAETVRAGILTGHGE